MTSPREPEDPAAAHPPAEDAALPQAADSSPAVEASLPTPPVAEETPQKPVKRRIARPAPWHVEPQPESEAEGWLLSYLDLITLLVAVLLVLLAFRGSGPVTVAPVPGTGSVDTPLMEAPPPLVPFATTDRPDPWKDLPRDHFGDGVELIVGEEQISFRISDAILFDSGRAELSNGGVRVLERLLPTFAAVPYALAVEGHTDDRPIVTPRFPSNWELSTARAARVVRYLERRGIPPERLSATGFAATRPIADNTDPAKRSANRRVELILKRPAEASP